MSDSTHRLELGLAILQARQRHGEVYTYKQIAAYTGGSWQYIYVIQKGAIKKLANKMLFVSEHKQFKEECR